MKVLRILPRIARACTVIFNPPSLYSSKQQMRRYCWERVREERARLGFDRMEVARIEIMSGFHVHAGVPICAPWITVRWWDKRNRIICHSTKGGRVYNRLHVYRDPALNMHDAILPTKLFAVKPENAKRAQKTNGAGFMQKAIRVSKK